MKFVIGLLIYSLIGIFIFMLIIVAIKYFKIKFLKNPVILLDKTMIMDRTYSKIYKANEIPIPNVDKGDQLGVTIGFRINLENAMENERWGKRFDQLKPIVNFFPSIYYHPLENYFEFGVEIKDNIQMTSYQTVKLNDPPLQKWINIIAVFNSTRIKIYLDDQLVISKKLKNPPIFKSRTLEIGEENNNFKGQLGPIIYWPYPLETDEIKKALKFLI
jgi:hypothetical protein